MLELDPRFWIMTIALGVGEAWDTADGHPTYTANTVNLEAMWPARQAAYERRYGAEDGHYPIEDMPVPRLLITAPGFAPDAFTTDAMTLYFSARMREIADLSEAEVQYVDIDASGSTDEVLAQDYRLVHFPAVRDGADAATVRRHASVDGTTGQPVLGAYSTFAFRAGFAPDVDVFHLPYGTFPYVTDAFAARVQAAGLDDLVFRHPAYAWEDRPSDMRMKVRTAN